MTDLPYESWREQIVTFISFFEQQAKHPWSDQEKKVIQDSLLNHFNLSSQADKDEGARQTFEEIVLSTEEHFKVEAMISEGRVSLLKEDLQNALTSFTQREQERIRESENRPPEGYIGKKR